VFQAIFGIPELLATVATTEHLNRMLDADMTVEMRFGGELHVTYMTCLWLTVCSQVVRQGAMILEALLTHVAQVRLYRGFRMLDAIVLEQVGALLEHNVTRTTPVNVGLHQEECE
jgi:hypothetical protein